MKRRGLTRILVTFLVVMALLVAGRMIVGPPAPAGLVVFVDLDPHELRHSAFELGDRTEIAIRATGSFDPEAMPAGLAAQGWILRRADREVVWRMDPQRVERGRGTVARVRGDTFALDAGLYDVYYATYGQTDTRSERWRSDAEKWQFVLRLIDETAPARLVPDERLDAADNLIWKTSPMRSDREEAYLFEVKEQTELEIYAVGEIDDEPKDVAWIEDAGTGARIWGMTRDNTMPAGGLASNRQFRGTLTLLPGAYRAVAQTDHRHAYRDWEANPPFDPAAWGLTLYAADPQAVANFDPWSSRDPLVSITRVPDNARLNQRFEVQHPIQAVLYAVGEMTDRHSIYDYAELFKEEADRKRSVWKMSWDKTVGAGGSDKNRLEVAFLRLEPGVYSLQYQSDGSHSFEYWNDDEPDYPARWGATLFPMAASLDAGIVRVLDAPEPDAWAAPNGPLNAAVANEGDPIVSWTRLRGDVEQAEAFELDKETNLHIVAVGEITRNGNQYDYGWIERAGTGEIVWEMTLDNTHEAGGADKNRRFDDVVVLSPGQYVVHYKTDDSHHYESFNDDDPDDPEAWGITIHYVAEEESADAGQ